MNLLYPLRPPYEDTSILHDRFSVQMIRQFYLRRFNSRAILILGRRRCNVPTKSTCFIPVDLEAHTGRPCHDWVLSMSFWFLAFIALLGVGSSFARTWSSLLRKRFSETIMLKRRAYSATCVLHSWDYCCFIHFVWTRRID